MSTINYETGLPYLADFVLTQYSHSTDPGPMTAEQFVQAWRQLIADGHSVNMRHSIDESNGETYCLITEFDEKSCTHEFYNSSDPDPLRSFEAAFRAYREAQEQQR